MRVHRSTHPPTHRALALLLSVLLLVIGLPIGEAQASEQVIFQTGFETGDSAMTVGAYPTPAQYGNTNPVSAMTWGSIAGTSANTAHGGSKTLWCAGNGGTPGGYYDDNMNTYAKTYIDLTGYSSAHVSFWYRTPGLADSGDLAALRISQGDDTSTVVNPWVSTTNNPTWTQVNASIPSQFIGKSNVRVEWAFISDQAAGAQGVFLDDVYIAGLLTPDTTPPTVPANLVATPSGNQAVLDWAASTDTSGVSGYDVERSSDGTNWTKLGSIAATSTPYYTDTVTGASQGKTWHYRVRAYDVVLPPNYSDYSNVADAYIPDLEAPSAPGNLAVAASGGDLRLSWDASSDNVGVSGYSIGRSEDRSIWSQLTTTTATNFTDHPSPNVTEYYRISAFDAAGNVSADATGTGIVDTQAPSTPGTLSVTRVGSDLDLTWGPSADNVGVTGYVVERSPDQVSWSTVATATSTSYADPAPANTTFYYRVSAFDAAGNSSGYATGSGYIDTIQPTTALRATPAAPDGSNGWYTTAPSIALAADETSTTYYQWDGTAGSWTTYSGSFIALSGNRTLYFYSVDLAGNTETTKSQAIKVDAGAPSSTTTSPAVAAHINGTSYMVTGSAIDNASGVARVEVSTDGGATWDLATGTTSWAYSWTLPSDGNYTIKSRATDNAGNVENPSAGRIVSVDNSAPTSTASTNPASADGSNGWFRTVPTVTLTASETSTIKYQWDSTSTAGWRDYTSAITALQNQHTLYFYATDLAGNSETTKSISLMVDSIAPTTMFTASPATANGSNGWYDGPIAPTVTLSSNEAGSTTYWYWGSGTAQPYDGTPIPVAEGQNVLNYYSVDQAGNVEATNHQAINYDATSPTVPSGVTASGGYGSAVISWAPSTDSLSGSGSYVVERSSAGTSGPWTPIGTVDGTSATDSGLLSATTYWYHVKAIDKAGNSSGYSVISASATTNASAINDATGDGLSDAIGFYDYGAATTGAWVFKTVPGANAAGVTFAPDLWYKSASGGFNLPNAKTVTGDFNGDGKVDVISLYNLGGTTSALDVFTSTGAGYQSPRRVFYSTGWSWEKTKLVSGDFNGDGKDELFAFYNYGGTNTGVFQFEQNADGSFKYPVQKFFSSNWSWDNTRLLSVKNGSKSKVVAAYNYGGTTTGLWVFELDDANNLKYPVLSFISNYWYFPSTTFLTGDVNADGMTDVIAFYNYGGTKTGVFTFYATGQPGTAAFAYPQFVYSSPYWSYANSTFIPGDFNGDGRSDAAAVYDYGGGKTGLWIFKSNSTKLADPVMVYSTPFWNNSATRWVMPY